MNSSVWLVLLGGFIAGGASLLATWFAHKNNVKIQKLNQEMAVKSLIQSIYDEFNTIFERYMWGIGKYLESLPPKEPIEQYYPLTHPEYFIIYSKNADLIGSIDDSELRKAIVQTYTKARSLIDSYRLNNDYLVKHDNFLNLYHETGSIIYKAKAAIMRTVLIEYTVKIKANHDDIKKDYEILKRRLEIWMILRKIKETNEEKSLLKRFIKLSRCSKGVRP